MSISPVRILVSHRREISRRLRSLVGFTLCAAIHRGDLSARSRFRTQRQKIGNPRGGLCVCTGSALDRLHCAPRPLYVLILPRSKLPHIPLLLARWPSRSDPTACCRDSMVCESVVGGRPSIILYALPQLRCDSLEIPICVEMYDAPRFFGLFGISEAGWEAFDTSYSPTALLLLNRGIPGALN